MSRLRRAIAALVAVAALAAMGWASRAPVSGGLGPEEGLIRLSWRLRAEGDGAECVRPTAEELAELPVHMRNPDECMGRGLSFVLEVSVDGVPLVSDTLEPTGARGDRPVFVLRDLAVSAGSHDLSVLFEPLAAANAEAHLLEESIRVRARQIVLVTWDPAAERLVLRESLEP